MALLMKIKPMQLNELIRSKGLKNGLCSVNVLMKRRLRSIRRRPAFRSIYLIYRFIVMSTILNRDCFKV